MSAAPAAIRQTRNAATLSSDIASLTAREKLIFSQAVYEFGVGGAKVWTEISRLLSKHPLLTGRGDKFFTAQVNPFQLAIREVWMAYVWIVMPSYL